MSKQHYFFKLIPPRPTFPGDITDQEKLQMEEHARYFHEQFTAGRVLLYGPVMAKDGTFGLGILEVSDQAEARHFGENDPIFLTNGKCMVTSAPFTPCCLSLSRCTSAAPRPPSRR